MNFAISSLESTAITGEVLPLYCKYVYLVYFTVSNIVCGDSKLWAEPKCITLSWTCFCCFELVSVITDTSSKHNSCSSVQWISLLYFDAHLIVFLFLDFTWHCSTAAAGLVTLDFISNTAFYAVNWVFSPQLHFPHSWRE